MQNAKLPQVRFAGGFMSCVDGKHSLYCEAVTEAERHKWIESEKAGYDLGESAIEEWNRCHWWGWCRSKWLEHLKGETYDGLEIFGSDSVRTVPPHETAAIDAIPMEIAAGLSVSVAPSPIRDVHTAYFELVGPMAVEVGQLQVKVFDLSGALVWEQIAAGAEIAWHTEDLHGRFLANGVYVYQVLAEVEGSWISVVVDKIAILR